MAFIPSGTEGFEKAEVTAGGVDTNELSAKTMESRKVPGLYFIGEVVDVTGHLGGFNFQWAGRRAMRPGRRSDLLLGRRGVRLGVVFGLLLLFRCLRIVQRGSLFLRLFLLVAFLFLFLAGLLLCVFLLRSAVLRDLLLSFALLFFRFLELLALFLVRLLLMPWLLCGVLSRRA